MSQYARKFTLALKQRTKIDIRIRCHEWQAVIAARAVENSGCPYCTGRRVLAGFNDLAALHPEIAAQWDDTLNGTLTPENGNTGKSQAGMVEMPRRACLENSHLLQNRQTEVRLSSVCRENNTSI